jgi:hypothetical protein
MKVNNKIRTAYVDQYCGAFQKFDWPEILTRSRKTCLESPYKIVARSNGRIENYNCFRKPGLLCFLRQNPNLTLLGSYHKVEPYHSGSLELSDLKIHGAYFEPNQGLKFFSSEDNITLFHLL